VALTRPGDGAIYLWDWKAGGPLRALRGHTASPFLLASVPEGRHLVSGTRDPSDRILSVWDVSRAAEVAQIDDWEPSLGPSARFLLRGYSSLQQPALAPDGRYLAYHNAVGRLQLVELPSGKARPASPFTWKGEGSVAFMPDGRQVVVCDSAAERAAGFGGRETVKTTLHQIDVPTGKELRQVNGTPLAFAVTRIEMTRTTALLGCRDGQLRVVDLTSGAETRTLGDAVKDPEPDPNGPFLASTLANRTPLFIVSPDRGTVAMRSATDNSVRLWEVASGKERARFAGHPGAITCLAFAADGRYLVTGSQDGTVLVWAIRPAGKVALRLNEKERDALWADLTGGDAAKAFDAVRALAAVPASAVALVRDRVKPATAFDEETFEKLVGDLDKATFAVRAKAQQKLVEMGERARPKLEKAAADTGSAEVRQRITEVLRKLTPGAASGAVLRDVRAVEVLEAVGDGPARELLAQLAKGAADARLTQDARDALERLKRIDAAGK
jgi:hypothetical protein